MPQPGALRRFKDKVTASIGRSSPASPPAPSGAPTAPPSTADTGGIALEYAPVRDGDADPGEVVWTWVAFEDDPTQGKDRPVLILGWDGPLLAAVPLSSKDHSDRRDSGEWVEVGRGAWDPQARVSYVNADRLLRVEPSAVRREGAALAEQAFERVLERVAELHEWHR